MGGDHGTDWAHHQATGFDCVFYPPCGVIGAAFVQDMMFERKLRVH
jgi:hypothetical protein